MYFVLFCSFNNEQKFTTIYDPFKNFRRRLIFAGLFISIPKPNIFWFNQSSELNGDVENSASVTYYLRLLDLKALGKKDKYVKQQCVRKTWCWTKKCSKSITHLVQKVPYYRYPYVTIDPLSLLFTVTPDL